MKRTGRKAARKVAFVDDGRTSPRSSTTSPARRPSSSVDAQAAGVSRRRFVFHQARAALSGKPKRDESPDWQMKEVAGAVRKGHKVLSQKQRFVEALQDTHDDALAGRDSSGCNSKGQTEGTAEATPCEVSSLPEEVDAVAALTTNVEEMLTAIETNFSGRQVPDALAEFQALLEGATRRIVSISSALVADAHLCGEVSECLDTNTQNSMDALVRASADLERMTACLKRNAGEEQATSDADDSRGGDSRGESAARRQLLDVRQTPAHCLYALGLLKKASRSVSMVLDPEAFAEDVFSSESETPKSSMPLNRTFVMGSSSEHPDASDCEGATNVGDSASLAAGAQATEEQPKVDLWTLRSASRASSIRSHCSRVNSVRGCPATPAASERPATPAVSQRPATPAPERPATPAAASERNAAPPASERTATPAAFKRPATPAASEHTESDDSYPYLCEEPEETACQEDRLQVKATVSSVSTAPDDEEGAHPIVWAVSAQSRASEKGSCGERETTIHPRFDGWEGYGMEALSECENMLLSEILKEDSPGVVGRPRPRALSPLSQTTPRNARSWRRTPSSDKACGCGGLRGSLQSCSVCRAQVVVKGAPMLGSAAVYEDRVTKGGESCAADVGRGNDARNDGCGAFGFFEDDTHTRTCCRSAAVVGKALRSPHGNVGSIGTLSFAQHHGCDGSPTKYDTHLATDVDGRSCSRSGNSFQLPSPRPDYSGRWNSDRSCASGNDVSSRAGGSGSRPHSARGLTDCEGGVRRFRISEADPSVRHRGRGHGALSPTILESSPFSDWCHSRRCSDTPVVVPPPAAKRPQRRRPALPWDLPALVGRKGMAGDAHPSDVELDTRGGRNTHRSHSELKDVFDIADLDAGWDRTFSAP